MTTITTEKRAALRVWKNYEIYVNGTYFGTWFGHDEKRCYTICIEKYCNGCERMKGYYTKKK